MGTAMKADKSIGQRIKKIRKKRGMTQEKFAKDISIDRAYLSRIERGERKPSDLVILAVELVFNVKREWLLTGRGRAYDPSAYKKILHLLDETTDAEREELFKLLMVGMEQATASGAEELSRRLRMEKDPPHLISKKVDEELYRLVSRYKDASSKEKERFLDIAFAFFRETKNK